MATGKELITLAKKHIGEKYVWGIIAPKNDSDYHGPFDCAEFASYIVFQVSGRLYGCAHNNGNPRGADAYSGFWGRDAEVMGEKITVDEGTRTEGSCLIRIAGDGMVGHVAFVQAKNKTVEAHSTKTGVKEDVVNGRRWDFAVKIPWITYVTTKAQDDYDPSKIEPKQKIYRLIFPYMVDSFIKQIQKKLKINADGMYGPQTFNAVRIFQLNNGLVPDGEAGPKTLKSLGLSSK